VPLKRQRADLQRLKSPVAQKTKIKI
jgi:hypothetical protein